jgi:hypothetical protein
MTLVYIDNLTFGLTAANAHRIDELRTIISALAGEWGLAIKPSSWEVGSSFVWRGIEIDLATRSYRLKTDFADKVEAAVKEATEASWNLRTGQSLTLIACIIYSYYTTGRPLAAAVDIMRFLSRLATALGTGDIDMQRVMRWPRDAASSAVKEVSELRRWRTRPCAPIAPIQVFGVSDAAGPSEDGSSRNLAYAFHSSSRMVVHSEPIVGTDIFALETKAMTDGIREASKDGTLGELRWLCDNLRSLFVVARGWSSMWEVNDMLLFLWSVVFPPLTKLSYVPSAYNIVDPFTRSSAPGRRERAACPEHPGQPCPEFMSFVLDCHKEFKTVDAPPSRRISWSTKMETVTFHPGQPAQALEHFSS